MPDRLIDRLVTIFAFEADDASLTRTKRRFEALQGGLNQMATGLAVAAGALVGVGFIAANSALAFEQAMNSLAAVSNASADEMARFREQAKQLGATTMFSATQVANAQVVLKQQGLAVNEVLMVMPHVLRLAIAGELDMASAAALTTGALRPFNIALSEAGHLGNLLAQTARSARTSVGELGPALRQVASDAAANNLSIEQTLALIATLRQNLREPAQAGTQLRAVMARLVAPSKEAAEILERLGFSLETIQYYLSTRQLPELFHALGQAQLGAGDAARVFGVEASGAAQIFANQPDLYKKIFAELQNVDGVLQQMADTMKRGLPGAVAEFKSAMEAFKLALFTSSEHSILPVLRNLTSLLRVFESLPGPVGWVIAHLTGLTIALAVAAITAKALAWALGSELLVSIFTKGIPALIAFTAKLWAATFAAGSLNAALLPIIGTVALLTYGILTTGAAWKKSQDQAREAQRTMHGTLDAQGNFIERGHIIDSLNTFPAPQQERRGGQSRVSQPVDNSKQFTFGDINISVPGGDAAEISKRISEETIKREFRSSGYDTDTTILR